MAFPRTGCRAVGAALALSLPAFALAACSSGTGGGASAGGKVTITVADLPTAQQSPSLRAQFLAAVSAFEKLHPNITVKPSEYEWAADTFPARLASGQLETVFSVPFTEPQSLIANGQVADLSQDVATDPELKQLNPRLLAVAQANGKTYGIPASGYAEGLMYNRALFTRAGLDPNQPPTTWAQLAADAKKIAGLGNGTVGFAMPTEQNTGGWSLTMINTAFGNQMEQKGGSGKYVANFNSAPGVAALTQLKTMRWNDHSMGDKALMTIDDVQKLMASGKLGMMMSAGDWLTTVIQTDGGPRADIGMGQMPQSGGNATLTGGSMEMISPKATDAQREAGIQWIEYEYLRTHQDPSAIASYYSAQAQQSGAVIGYPELPLFNETVQATFEQARKPYVNLPTQNYAPYVRSLNSLNYVPEPPIDAQTVYKMLDGAVQQVLSESGANPKTVLDSAANQVNSTLANDQ